MSRIKQWIKNKLIIFLGIDGLITLFDKHIDNNVDSFNEFNRTMYNLNNETRRNLGDQISHFQQSVNILHNTVENVVHIGTDIREYNGHSWAVVCIEGKMNLVKFVDLGVKDARYVLDFLKQFEGGRHCIDTPNKCFYGDLFKF